MMKNVLDSVCDGAYMLYEWIQNRLNYCKLDQVLVLNPLLDPLAQYINACWIIVALLND